MIIIDGSEGEGGGSIIRLSCAFSALTKKPIKIINIRAKRANPGLQAQHLTSVKALSEICDAKTKGLGIGSTELEFHPSNIKNSNFSFDIGTAGSISLVLQAIMILNTNCKIEITGGTMVKFAPPIDYLQNVTLPVLRKFGYKGNIEIIKHGFYPKGGGIVKAEFKKSKLTEINIADKGELLEMHGIITISKDLENYKVAEKIQNYCHDNLLKEFKIVPKIEKEYVSSLSTGGGVNLFIKYENSIIGSNSLIDKNKSSENVAKEAVDNLIDQKESVDEYLEDQLIPYLALYGGSIKIHALTNHTKTNIWLAEQFFPVKFKIENKIIRAVI